MKNKNLLKTNLNISIILIIGFALTAIFSYRANYQASLNNIEQVSSLTAEGIYYKLTTQFTKPVNVSLTMAHDSLLIEHLLAEPSHLEDEEYAETIKTYLRSYQEKYLFDSVFLISTATGRYYNFNGIDRILTKENAENEWYYDFLSNDLEYFLNVDNDEVNHANNEITVFVNCKIQDSEGETLGVVGVGIRIDYLKDLLKSYEEKYNLETFLISKAGNIEISTSFTGYEKKDWFTIYNEEAIREAVLGWNDDSKNLEFWTNADSVESEKNYIVTRYIPELSWNLVVRQNTGLIIREMKAQLYQSAFILTVVIVSVLIIISTVIRNFNRQITCLLEERQESFKKATALLYDNIYELNITRNCPIGAHTRAYFNSLGAKGLSFDESLLVIAQKQIKEEFREGYLQTFSTQNVLREYEAGKNHLCYDFMLTQDGQDYFWMRIDAHIFFSTEDNSLHMLVYQKNIDAEKKREVKAMTDEMTGFYNKKDAERSIDELLQHNPGARYAFFLFDIDNFKQVNDRFGHAFGDFCIQTFTSLIHRNLESSAVLGRLGGDEFVAFLPYSSEKQITETAENISALLNTVCTDGSSSWDMSASIGIALSPADGVDFYTLYKNADTALYRTKEKGKNGFTIYC